MPNIHVSIVDGKSAVCFDTGLDPRAFARTKMSQSLIEPGYVVRPDGSHEVWKSLGVKDLNNNMRVWGSPFSGKRLDHLIERDKPDNALQAVIYWIRAKLLLGEPNSSLNPGASFVCLEDGAEYPKGSVFFTPKNLSNRCLYLEEASYAARTEVSERSETARESLPVMDRYNCPDLNGMEAAAFCAGAMLYRILTNVFPYQFTENIYQDMREGVFLPPHLAYPGLDKKTCDLIFAALLLPVDKKRTGKSGTDILNELLNLLMEKDGRIAAVSALISQKNKEEKTQIEKEKKLYLLKQKTMVNTRRFVARNKYVLMGSSVAVLFVLFVVLSTTSSFKNRPTTEGMTSEAVVYTYYEAFSTLDHMLMEACVQGAGKQDIDVAAQFSAVLKARQAYEQSMNRTLIISARAWKESGGELPAPNVFGVTDLVIENITGSEYDPIIIYRTEYLLWSPDESYPRNRSDTITLKRDRKKNWRITEILRIER